MSLARDHATEPAKGELSSFTFYCTSRGTKSFHFRVSSLKSYIECRGTADPSLRLKAIEEVESGQTSCYALVQRDHPLRLHAVSPSMIVLYSVVSTASSSSSFFTLAPSSSSAAFSAFALRPRLVGALVGDAGSSSSPSVSSCCLAFFGVLFAGARFWMAVGDGAPPESFLRLI